MALRKAQPLPPSRLFQAGAVSLTLIGLPLAGVLAERIIRHFSENPAVGMVFLLSIAGFLYRDSLLLRLNFPALTRRSSR